jgi:thiamine pyrophosphate-dependent acetolactate synthase large subunit-like protein
VLLCGDAPDSGRRRFDIEQDTVCAGLGVPVTRLSLADPVADVRQAVALARREACPVVLCVPFDVGQAEAPEASPAPAEPIRGTSAPAVPAGALDAVHSALEAARRPLVLAGLGAWRSGATAELTELADRSGALLATTVMANGMFAGNPWSIGVCGGFASPRAAALIGEADLVLSFGATLDRFTLRDQRLLSRDALLVSVTIDGRPSVDRIDLSVTGDAAEVAAALLDRYADRTLSAPSWRAEVADVVGKLGWADEPYEDAGVAGRIDPRTLSLALAGMLPEDRTVVLDGGHFIAWPSMYWPVPDPHGFVFTGSAFQAIGMGFAGAVGAVVGRPDRTTVVALGDGGALMGLPELETLIRTAGSVIVVVYDDGAYGYEVHMFGPRGADLRTASFADTDFAGVARALGATAVTVRSVDDLAALRAWREDGARGALVLDCKVARDVVAGFLSEIVAAR